VVVLRAYLEEQKEGGLDWSIDETAGYEGTFVSASPASNEKKIIDGVYFFNELSVKLKLLKSMFTGPNQVLRVQYDTHLVQQKAVRLNIGSFVGKNRIVINDNLLC